MSKVLVIGCGGREHAIVKALKKDDNVKIYCMGNFVNPAIFKLSTKYCTDTEKLVEFAKLNRVDFAIIGPEAYLQRGTAELLAAIDIPCIGPTSNLAKLETSKIFARTMMKEEWDMAEYLPEFSVVKPGGQVSLNHPTPFPPEYDIENFSLKNMERIEIETSNNYVIKMDGLESGKGVIVSQEHFTDAGDALTRIHSKTISQKIPFLIEEKLSGKEFSLMSFCDGTTLRHMPIVRDFKRAFNGDKGPNTGGMGTISYQNHRLDFLTEGDVEIARSLNEMTVKCLQDYMEEEYKGILYGSFIKTDDGKIKIIEYNCRFGDPECINVLALLETSFLDICKAIINGKLYSTDIHYANKFTVCRYLVPNGYPTAPVKKHEIYISGTNHDNLIYANVSPGHNWAVSTDVRENLLDFTKLLQLGSRTIAGIGMGDTLYDATEMVIEELNKVTGPLFYRKDIGYMKTASNSYLDCGVDITKGNEVVSKIGKYILDTYNENVCGDFGDFGGMFRFKDSILVSSTDGVGTKSILAHDVFGNQSLVNLGKDLVNHCVNDILVKGAKPLFFLDYFASSSIDKEAVELFVKGVSQSCKSSECALIGGETAEMPGVYTEGKMDFVGTIVGCLDEKDVIDGKRDVKKGDVVIGLRSSGPHTNGYSLIRKLVRDGLLDEEFVKTLLEPHRCYYPDVKRIQSMHIPIHALCHITGGGIIENPKRVLPDGMKLKLHDDFEISDMFKIIQIKGEIPTEEMLRVFNCGIGMMVITDSMYKNDIIDMFRGNYATEIGVIE